MTAATSAASTENPTALRGRFGVDLATRLGRSTDPDDRLRALARAGALGTPEAVALLSAALDPTLPSRGDARTRIEVARGLAGHVEQAAARSTLLAIVNLPNALTGRGSSLPFRAPSDPFGDEAEQAARLEVARRTAALALAESGDARAQQSLLALARGGGAGQTAAALALLAYPPASIAGLVSGTMTPAALRLIAELGDLRGLEAARGATRANDVPTRAAALLTLGALGDTRGLEVARAALAENDAYVRAAAAEALVQLEAPERLAVVEVLIGDDSTAAAGIRLAERADSDGIVHALAARAASASDPALRAAAVVALGRSSGSEAVKALVALARDPWLQGDAADALARSPSADATRAIEALAVDPALRRLAVRAYVVRAGARGERSHAMRDVIAALARSADPRDRAVATFARICAGERDAADALGDNAVEVRRAAALAALGDPRVATRRALLARLRVEPDAATQEALAAGLVEGDPDGQVTTSMLLDRAESGGPDAPLAALAFARRAGDAEEAQLTELFASRDPLLRAHVARGLGAGTSASAIGRLANAYAYEADATVRRAIVLALAARADAAVPVSRATLAIAARLDPDASVRWIAARGALGLAPPPVVGPPPGAHEIAWVRLATADGAPPAARAGGRAPDAAAFVRADGLAVPVVFDADGYALIPGTPPGEARLVLAPKLSAAYEPSK